MTDTLVPYIVSFNKIVKTKANILVEIEKLIYGYVSLYNRGPADLVLGPVEFLSFVNEIHSLAGIPFGGIQGQYEYKGLPVEVSRKPGLDVLINKTDAIKFSMGEVAPPIPPPKAPA